MQLSCRLMHEKWRPGLKQDHLLRVLQCTRLLSRDKALRQRFVSQGAVQVTEGPEVDPAYQKLLESWGLRFQTLYFQVLSEIFKHEALAHFSGSVTQFQVRTNEVTQIRCCGAGIKVFLHRCCLHCCRLRP